MAKVGRPGEDRAKAGRVRAAVRPEIKQEAEFLARQDSRLRSLSQLCEAALAYYIRDYKAASGSLDMNNFPVMPASIAEPIEAAPRPPSRANTRPPIVRKEPHPTYQRRPASEG